jgi:hypothetical protein
MATRADRLRKVIPGAPDELIIALAARSAAEVDLTLAALKQARRDAINEDKARRRRKVAERRARAAAGRPDVEDEQLAEVVTRQLDALARRAGENPETLTLLGEIADDYGPECLGLAVDDLRTGGVSDAEIGRSLGVTRWAIGDRFGRGRMVRKAHHASQPQGDPDLGSVVLPLRRSEAGNGP